MILIVTVALLGVLAEGAVLQSRQTIYNNTQFQGQFPQFPGQGQVPFQQFQGQNQGFVPGFPQPPPPFVGVFPPQQQQQQQQGGQQSGQQGSQRADVAVPVDSSSPIPIVKLEVSPNLGDGKYQYSYETGNGIKAEEKGEQKEVGEPKEAGTVAVGSYSYTDPDGNLISVTYTADENGFVPQGDHIPTAPPVPAEILAALEKNAAEEASQNNGVVSPAYHFFFRNAYRYRHY